jgi:hypothetical protein
MDEFELVEKTAELSTREVAHSMPRIDTVTLELPVYSSDTVPLDPVGDFSGSVETEDRSGGLNQLCSQTRARLHIQPTGSIERELTTKRIKRERFYNSIFFLLLILFILLLLFLVVSLLNW